MNNYLIEFQAWQIKQEQEQKARNEMFKIQFEQMNELNILVEQIQRKQESSMGMVQALKLQQNKKREIEQAVWIAAEKKAKR